MSNLHTNSRVAASSESDDEMTGTEKSSLINSDVNSKRSDRSNVAKPLNKTGWSLSCRATLSLISFFGFINVYALRVNLSVAIVAMVNVSQEASNNTECMPPNVTITPKNQTGEFNWSHTLQGTILGSFFYGYLLTNPAGGYLSQRFGAKWFYGCGVLATAVLTLLTPIAARAGSGVLIALRVAEGFFEGVTFPAMHAMWAVWAPVLERSKLVAFSYSGAHIGTVISLPISGYLASSHFLGGWPSVFYVFGTLGCIWFIFWCFLAYNSPEEHPRISREEQLYIEKSIGPPQQKSNLPWREILTSLPVWAIVVAHVACNWSFYTMLTTLPTYLSHILHFNLKSNGVLSAVPYFFLFLIISVFGFVADYLRSRKYLSTKNTRKMFVAVGMGVSAIFMISIGFTGCDVNLALVLVIISVATIGFTFPGYMVNHVDIAPPYAGTLMGLTNMFATIPGFVGPQVVGVLTNKHENRHQWQYVFIISAVISVIGGIVFVIFADGEEQEWSKRKSSSNEKQF